MKRWMALLDAVTSQVNPGLVIAAMILAILDVAAAGQRWTLTHPQAPAKIVMVAANSEQCTPALPPDLREMAGRD